jgi:hypothetical protein
MPLSSLGGIVGSAIRLSSDAALLLFFLLLGGDSPTN